MRTTIKIQNQGKLVNRMKQLIRKYYDVMSKIISKVSFSEMTCKLVED